MDNTEQILKKQIENSPIEIKKFLSDSNWTNIVSEVSTQNGFTEEQKISLENEVLFVIIGLELRSNFTKNIQDNVGVPSIVAGGIALDIDQKIFSLIQNFLPTAYEDSSRNTETLGNLAQEILNTSTSNQTEEQNNIPKRTESVINEVEVPHNLPVEISNPTIPAPVINETTPSSMPLKAQSALEEKITPLIGTPGEKIDWEERKQAIDRDKIITGSYNGKDPYREPLG